MASVSRTRIVGNKHSGVRAATLSASTQRASTQLYLLSQQRAGNGHISLSGPYTGAVDSIIDVEVLNTTPDTLRASTPVVNGIGNGTLDVQTIDTGADPQTLQFSLLDAGTTPKPAVLDFFGVQLGARASGTSGNTISVSAVRNLTFTPMPFATLDKMTTGAATFSGPQFDWGQPAATGSDIPDGALRIAFVGIPTIYRSWKTWDAGHFTYHVDPPLVYDVDADTQIEAVTGDYTLTVTDGTTPETYTAVTMYDFLTQVQARSLLIQVLGVVAQDKAPGGQAVTDIPLRTDAHALPIIETVANKLAEITVGDVAVDAATQNITVICLGRTGTANGQSWSVAGGVDGQLPAASTGVPYALGPVAFTIGVPRVAVALESAITAVFTPTSRDQGEGLPLICFKPLLLGVAATNKEVTFEYKARPAEECNCSTAKPLKVSLQCLGLEPDGGTEMDAEYQSRLIDLYAWQSSFVASNIALVGLDKDDVDTAVSCTSILADALAEIFNVPAAATAWDGVFADLQSELAPFMGLLAATTSAPGGGAYYPDTGGGPGAAAWTPRSMAVGGSYLNPINSHKYTVTAIHIDGGAVNSTPVDATLPLPDESTVWKTDGTIGFTVTEVTDVVISVTDMGLVQAWGGFAVDRVFDSINPEVHPAGVVPKVRITEILVAGVSAVLPTDAITWSSDRFNVAGVLTGTSVGSGAISVSSVQLPEHEAGATVAVGDEIINSLNHHGYRVTAIAVATVDKQAASARLPAFSSDIWLTDLSDFDVTMPAAGRTTLTLTVTDADLVVPTASTGAAIDQRDRDEYFAALRLPPNPGDGSPAAAWGVSVDVARTTWQDAALKASFDARRAYFRKVVEYFPQKYAVKMDWVRTVAGIPPKASAGSAGSPCWRDFGDSFWWADIDNYYLPVFTNHPYVSARQLDDGSIVSTQEFGFGLITQCGGRLKEGDRITIKIAGANNSNSWAVGDKFVIPLIGAASAPLVGGSDGDPTQTWTVRSSTLGPLTDYSWLASSPAPWAHAPATVELVPGGIAFEVGDTLSFDIEGGQLRWRRDAGSWTTEDIFDASPISLGDGLALVVEPDVAPSFVGGDTWQFSAVATYGVSRMRQPRIGQAFAWDGPTVTISVDMLSALPLEAVMLALHNIPLTASVMVSGGLADATEWTHAATVRKGVILAVVPAASPGVPLTARYLSVVVTSSGSGGSIGWLWAGMGWQPTVSPSSMKLKRQYGLSRGAGVNPAALYRGAGTGGVWTWNLDNNAALFASSARDLMDLVDYSAEQGLEPVALFPDILDGIDASVALLDIDEIELTEFSNWQDSGTNVVSLELPLRAVLA